MNDKEQIINVILSNEAQDRFKRIKTYHKARGEKIEQALVNLYMGGRIQGQISDEEFLKFISQFEQADEDIVVNINRKRRDWDLDDIN